MGEEAERLLGVFVLLEGVHCERLIELGKPRIADESLVGAGNHEELFEVVILLRAPGKLPDLLFEVSGGEPPMLFHVRIQLFHLRFVESSTFF